MKFLGKKRKHSTLKCEQELVSVSKEDIPEYLKQGELYQSFNDDPDDQLIDVPGNTLKPNIVVNSSLDLRYLLSSLRYWGVSDIPQSIIEFVLTGHPMSSEAVLDEFEGFEYVDLLRDMLRSDSEERMELAAEYGELQVVRILHDNLDGIACEDACLTAAGGGHLDCLVFLHEQGYRWDFRTCAAAARCGSLECLTYAHKNGCLLSHNMIDDNFFEASIDEMACTAAASGGHLACLQYAHENKCPWHLRTTIAAAEGGHLSCLKYAHEKGCKWNADVCAAAAKCGSLACLQYAHENGCKWEEETCQNAAKNGHLECLKYAHENGCPCDFFVVAEAVQAGRVEIVRYLHENGYPFGFGDCATAAGLGHLECLQYLHEQGSPWGDAKVCTAAAEGGHLDCLKYAHEHGCSFSSALVKRAKGSRGNLCFAYVSDHC